MATRPTARPSLMRCPGVVGGDDDAAAGVRRSLASDGSIAVGRAGRHVHAALQHRAHRGDADLLPGRAGRAPRRPRPARRAAAVAGPRRVRVRADRGRVLRRRSSCCRRSSASCRTGAGHWRVMQWGPFFGARRRGDHVRDRQHPADPRARGCSRAPRPPRASRRSSASSPSRRRWTRACAGKAVARFEAATLAGLLAGFAVGRPAVRGPGHRSAFLVNGVLYLRLARRSTAGASIATSRHRCEAPHAASGGRIDFSRYRAILGRSPRLAPRADLGRGQRGPRPVHDPDDLPARPRPTPSSPTSC